MLVVNDIEMAAGGCVAGSCRMNAQPGWLEGLHVLSHSSQDVGCFDIF